MSHISFRSFISIPSSPSTSPPSSPCPCLDSSPASSPRLDSGNLSDDLELEALELPSQHPLAGSAKQTKQPRIYEQKPKRSLSPSSPVVETLKRARFLEGQPPSPSEFHGSSFDSTKSSDFDPGENSSWPDGKSPEQLFRDVIDTAVTESSRHICFERKSLSYIPEEAIRDLQDIVILDSRSERTFASHEAPSRPSHAPGSHYRRRSNPYLPDLDRTSSVRVLSGVPREQMHLLLADNALTRLPPQLFRLEHLAVLSLRSNNLAFLPPEISFLTCLKELNVSNNRLSFLPAEMMKLKLSSLSIQPNHFIEPPPDAETSKFRRTMSRHRTLSKSRLLQDKPRLVSPVRTVFEGGIPSLFELSLRALFASSTGTSRLPAKLELPYDIPADVAARLPPLVLHRLHFACPGMVKGYSTNTQPPDSDSVTGLAFCRSPCHSVSESDQCGPLFFQHVEERFTWESSIAGVDNLGEIPVKWRGCQRGCLAYLDTEDPTAAEASSGSTDALPPSSTPNASQVSTDIVKAVTFEAAAFTDAEDFDDDE